MKPVVEEAAEQEQEAAAASQQQQQQQQQKCNNCRRKIGKESKTRAAMLMASINEGLGAAD
jgi:hypothetical protein